MKSKIRDLENMPIEIKIIYSKLLGLMAFVEEDSNQLKIGELYRIIKKIELPSKERIQLLNYTTKKGNTLEDILKEVDFDEYLNDQEKNIFRFSLMKDLINIMKVDYIDTKKEIELIKAARDYFNITDEQYAFFEEEYELDKIYFDEDIESDEFKKIVKTTIATATSLGIPLTTIYYSGTFKGLGYLGTISGLRSIGMKRKTGKHSAAIGLGLCIATGLATFKAMQCLLELKKDEKSKISNLMKEEMEILHENTKEILYEDIEYFLIRRTELKDEDKNELEKLTNLLKRAVATLENTDPVVI